MRGTTPMNMGACIGFRETLGVNRTGASTSDRYSLNQYVGKNFFEDENYRAALERLDGGYQVSMEFIEWMQDYCDTEREQARSWTSFAHKWVERIKQQSTLVSYHTTKRAQLDVVRIPKHLAQLKESHCDEIQKVIDKYRNYVNEMYVNERFRPSRKHRRAQEFKKAFKAAHASLSEVTNQLDTLQTQEKKAREAVRKAESVCEILELDPTTTEKQQARADEDQIRKRKILSDIGERLKETKAKHKGAQKTYRKKAKEIFTQCQYVEEERLNHMRETLLDFIQAMHTEKHCEQLNEIFDNISKKVATHQDSFEDIVFWAETYGITNKFTKSLAATIKDDDLDSDSASESRTHRKSFHHGKEKSDKRQSIAEHEVENDEERSAIVTSTHPTKTKVKRTRSATTTDKKHHHTGEISSANNTILNQV